jgi:hypothetical protein
VRERERERLKVIYVLDAKYEHSKKKKKNILLTSIHRKDRDEEDNKDKNGYSIFSHAFSPLCQIQWEKRGIYSKSYFVSGFDYAKYRTN